MRALLACEMLEVWERGQTLQPFQRALTLLSAACPQTPLDVLAQISIGQRDACLLTLREWAFGSKLVSMATCPHCGDRLELSFNVADIRVSSKAELESETLSLSVADYDVCFRLPNSLDIAAITNHKDVTASQQMLFERCLIKAHHQGEEQLAKDLPVEIVEAIANVMAETDPQADIQIGLVCPVCSHQWQATFDIVSFFWSEINSWAYRILRDVHTLASAYGWSEAEILALTPWRRQFYLEMASR
ncbi:MAG: hypothetical protein U7123_18200 [Potamolinea sp.]